MQILSHRGYWKLPEEKNTDIAFVRSFQFSFGTETDIRDKNGDLVISHDPPGKTVINLAEFLSLYKQHGAGLPLALNIKADGLQTLLKNLLERFEIFNYFVFDMSVPDMLGYLEQDLTVFTRCSEYEALPALYDSATGVWMDCFESEWIQAENIQKHLNADKRICLVSPELHKREFKTFWHRLSEWKLHREDALMLCTDFPEQAREHFYG